MGAVYLRLVGSATDIYEQLEPLYADYRKLKLRLIDDSCKILHMDEFVEMLLTLDSFCDIKLPFLIKRNVLEKSGKLSPYISPLETSEELKAILAKKNTPKEDDERRVSSGTITPPPPLAVMQAHQKRVRVVHSKNQNPIRVMQMNPLVVTINSNTHGV